MTNQEVIETIKANYPPENYSMLREALDIALALLKEQEMVRPTWDRGKPFCGACGLQIRGGKFCSECGKQIAWEGR